VVQGFDGLPCEDWEVELFSLAMHFKCFQGLSAWEAASAEKRLSHTYKVVKLARELADVMEEEPHPYYPPVLALFDEERSIDIISELPEDTARELLSCIPHYESASVALSNLFISSDEQQELPSILRRQAEIRERAANKKRLDTRPNTGNPDARAFARYLANHFKELYKLKRMPNEVIAACVVLKFPELDSPPSADDIRFWRRAM
jgi:hypothetical protein